MNICYAPDNNYAIPCAISIQSLMHNLNPNKQVSFLILDGGLNNKSKKIIEQIVEQYSNAKLTFVKVNDKEFLQFYTDGWKTSATYRFKIDSILKDYKKVLYLDCDTIINKTIDELYDINLGNNIIAMVPDIWYKKQNKRFPNKTQPYFNTGVCLLNLELFRKENISKKLISYYLEHKNSIIFPDQDPINIVLDNRILELNYKFNWCWHWEKNEYFEEKGNVDLQDAVVIHYIFNKPWWSTNIHPVSWMYYETIKTIPNNIRKEYSKFNQKKIILYKNFYLFCVLPILKIINCYTTEYWSVLHIPILKIKRNTNSNKYLLFKVIPILKINQPGNLEKYIEYIKAWGKY